MYKINIERLREYIDENYNSINEFARNMGLSSSYVSMVLKGERIGGGKLIARLMAIGWGREDIFLPDVSTNVTKEVK